MTAIKEGDIQPHTWDAYKRVLDENKLKVRVFVLWDVGKTLDAGRATLARIKTLPLPPRALGDDVLLSGGGKLYMDGSGGLFKTAGRDVAHAQRVSFYGG